MDTISSGVPLVGKETRLLELDEGQWTSPLIGRLVQSSLDANPGYTALSYVWGTAKRSRPIYLSGKAQYITPNLDAALRRVRKLHKRIVRQRLEKRPIPHAFTYLKALSNLKSPNDNQEGSACLHTIPMFHTPNSESARFQEEYFESVRLLICSSWWTRIWTVQEVVVPKNIVFLYGSETITWDAMSEAAARYQHHALGCCSKTVSVLPTAHTKVIQLYALLGLLNKSAISIRVDYQLDAPLVFINAAFDCIRTSQSLSILTLAGGQKYHGSLPSWVPDFGIPESTPFNTFADEQYRLYDAAKGTNAYNPRANNQSRPKHFLETRGTVIGTVVGISDPMIWDHEESCADVLGKWLWQGYGVRRFKPFPTDSKYETVFWRLICGDILPKKHPSTGFTRALLYDFSSYLSWLVFSNRSPLYGLVDPLWKSPDNAAVVETRLSILLGITSVAVLGNLIKEYSSKFSSGSPSEVRNRTRDFLWHLLKRLFPDENIQESFAEQFDRAIGISTARRRCFAWAPVAKHSHNDPLPLIYLHGLGPLDVCCGDSVVLLQGGRCPFVVRKRDVPLSSTLEQTRSYLQGFGLDFVLELSLKSAVLRAKEYGSENPSLATLEGELERLSTSLLHPFLKGECLGWECLDSKCLEDVKHLLLTKYCGQGSCLPGYDAHFIRWMLWMLKMTTFDQNWSGLFTRGPKDRRSQLEYAFFPLVQGLGLHHMLKDLIGPCILPGFMDGEALEGDVTWRDIFLR
ncbi:hypothetical protein NA57DRAFT_51272 [Rhizodiscina lignyota]|uniref:Heterokaryon incompatibility domain-containing protein n=1 Tax=Rhizodiscina lignyota TaxID=1504668 RepID=A0A9P4IRG8_9PEZI|nr:hypothetical protein NA57DRAFT_51272 [Rhizodiscina lignyota]